jgi:hypothetical protein
MSCTTSRSSRSSRSWTSDWPIQEWAVLVATTQSPRMLPVGDALDDLVVGEAGPVGDAAPRRCRGSRRPRRGGPASVKSRPPNSPVVLENSREPMALHWPVIEFAPVPGRPMLPVSRARSMIACAVRVPWWDWLTPIVHHNDTASPAAMVSAHRSSCATSARSPPPARGCRRRRARRSARSPWCGRRRRRGRRPHARSAGARARTAARGRCGTHGEVLGGRGGGLGAAGVDDDQLGVVGVAGSRSHRIGWATARLEPTSTTTSEASRSA